MIHIDAIAMGQGLGVGFIAALFANIQHGAIGSPKDILVMLPTAIATYFIATA